MSGVLIKTGIYGIVRVCAFGLGVPALPGASSFMRLGARVGGAGRALRADADTTSSGCSRTARIENIGIILLGLGRRA